MIGVGTAGWSLPRAVQDAFAEGDSHLARYASRFPVAEINSSFHRPHQRSLYEKWAAAAAVLADPKLDSLTSLDVRVPERPAAGGAAGA